MNFEERIKFRDNFQKKQKWLKFYERHELNSLGLWLFGGIFSVAAGYMDRDLNSINWELESSIEKALMEFHELSFKLDIEKTTEFINKITQHVNQRIKELAAYSEKFQYPAETVYHLIKTNGEECEIEAEMDEGLEGEAIENLHMVAILPHRIDEVDLEGSCTWLDDHFGLVKGEFLRFFPTYKVSFQHQLIDFQLEHLESFLDQTQFYLPINMQPEPDIKYSHLREVFIQEEQFEEFIELLRIVEPPIIGEKGNYILRSRKKGAIVAFFHVLNAKGKLKEYSPKDLQPLVEDYFKMTISRRVLSKCESKPFYEYKYEFEKLIPVK
jgi:hypothetical protein